MGVVCQILINKPAAGVHIAGGTVSGVVKYAIDQPTEYKDIVLSFKGESYCSWSEPDSSSTYTGKEEHVSHVVSLPGRIRTLPAGTYEHEFRFKLPRNIPPSFKHPTGNVTYQILLEFKKEGIFSKNKKFDARIPVQNHLDPTLPDTAIMFGVDRALLKPFSFGNHKINLKVEIATPFLKPGDKAQLKFMINNNSTLRIMCIRAELVSVTVFTDNGGRKWTSTKRIGGCRVESEGISPYQNATMIASVATLLHHLTVQYSKVVSHEYKILVTVVLPWPHCNAKVAMPVLIGWTDGELKTIEGMDVKSMDRKHPPQYIAEWQNMGEYKEKSRKLRKK